MSLPRIMTPIRALLFFTAFVVVFGSAFAADDSQEAAEALLDRARQLSDVRSPKAPAFRLTLTFSFTGKDLETVQGTYTEVWMSGSEWRRETVVGNSRRIEVGGLAKRWLFDTADDFPDQAAGVPALVEPLPARIAKLDFESITESDPATRCALTKPKGELRQQYAFCFDKTDGLLVAKVTPDVMGPRVADYSCNYSQFLKFGEYWFPHEMVCFLDGHRKMEARVVDLSLAPSADAALFAPPTGAVEMGTCPNNPVPPRAVNALAPKPPLGMRDRRSSVLLWMVVDTKGKPQKLKVSRSGGKQFDDSALFTVRGWHFKPATCNGEPMAVPLTVEIKFWGYR
jgi:TonB family protein